MAKPNGGPSHYACMAHARAGHKKYKGAPKIDISGRQVRLLNDYELNEWHQSIARIIEGRIRVCKGSH